MTYGIQHLMKLFNHNDGLLVICSNIGNMQLLHDIWIEVPFHEDSCMHQTNTLYSSMSRGGGY